MHISSISFSTSPFELLSIPIEKKRVVMALAENRMNRTCQVGFDDVIAGKGQGIIVLLQYDLHLKISSSLAKAYVVARQALGKP